MINGQEEGIYVDQGTSEYNSWCLQEVGLDGSLNHFQLYDTWKQKGEGKTIG